MKKTGIYVKDPGGTMYFPQAELTREEALILHQYGQVRPGWIKAVFVNCDEFADIYETKRMKSKDGYQALLDMWKNKSDELMHDLVRFADGACDLVDFVVKYGVSHKQCRQFFKDVLADRAVDVDDYWKQHKRHAQKETTIALYGVSHTSLKPDVQEKRRATNREKYGASNPMQNPDIREKIRKGSRMVPGTKFRKQEKTGIMAGEEQIRVLLDSIGVGYSVIQYKDDDQNMFFIPDKDIGITVNPGISHNSNKHATGKDRQTECRSISHHYIRYKHAKDSGITLIQLFGNDLDGRVFEDVTSKRLATMLAGPREKYHARKVEVRLLESYQDKKEARAFLGQYHSQGSSRATEYWAFIVNGKWVGAASFNVGNTVELKRLCFRPDVQVVGGLSKLIACYFRAYPDCRKIYSYSDNNLGSGSGYEKAGAGFIKETGPSLRFVSPVDGRDAYSWQIATSWGAAGGVIGNDAADQGLEKPVTQDEIDAYIEFTLKHRYDDGRGYDRIYTAGSKLWVFERP